MCVERARCVCVSLFVLCFGECLFSVRVFFIPLCVLGLRVDVRVVMCPSVVLCAVLCVCVVCALVRLCVICVFKL